MTSIQATILGLVQGLTEFLPISSSGHLAILQNLFQFSEPPIAFDVLLHVATLGAVGAFFFNDIRRINRARMVALLAGTIPTGIIGIILEKQADWLFSSVPLLSIGFFLTTLLLLSTLLLDRVRVKTKITINIRTAVLIGIAQGISIIPSLSRSAATIVTALWLGVDREDAARFSFLLSIPAILGAQLLEIPSLLTNNHVAPSSTAIGFFTAFVAGFLSLRWLMAIVKGKELHWFALYTGALALLLAIV